MLPRSLFVLAGFATSARLGGAFQVVAPVVPPPATTRGIGALPPRRHNCWVSRCAAAVDDREEAAAEADDEVEGEEYVAELSPMQIRFLRKEIQKRRARRNLARFALPEAESSGLFEDGTLTAIADMIEKDELVEVRGVSRGRKRDAFRVSEELALALTYEMGRDAVFVVDRTGFTAVLYCPAMGDDSEEEGRNKIRLRTSVGQKNVWTKREKAPRDHRGQIIVDEND